LSSTPRIGVSPLAQAMIAKAITPPLMADPTRLTYPMTLLRPQAQPLFVPCRIAHDAFHSSSCLRRRPQGRPSTLTTSAAARPRAFAARHGIPNLECAMTQPPRPLPPLPEGSFHGVGDVGSTCAAPGPSATREKSACVCAVERDRFERGGMIDSITNVARTGLRGIRTPSLETSTQLAASISRAAASGLANAVAGEPSSTDAKVSAASRGRGHHREGAA
jgi:hypothetical protein